MLGSSRHVKGLLGRKLSTVFTFLPPSTSAVGVLLTNETQPCRAPLVLRAFAVGEEQMPRIAA